MELWQLYLLMTLPEFAVAFGIVCFVVGLFTIGMIIAALVNHGDSYQEGDRDWTRFLQYKKAAKMGLTACVVTGFLAAAIPTSKALYTIVGGYYVTNLDGIKDLPPNVVAAANNFLKKYGNP